jgi:broad specificity phosphatase PhoE
VSSTGGDDRAAATRLLLVRHGESTWNADGRWQGQADPPLSELGAAQARAGAGALAGIDGVWSSDLARARETAELCAPAGTAVRSDPRFRERDVGSWTGLTRDAIEDRYPGWLADRRRPEGWEDDAVFAERAWQALGDVAAVLDPGGCALVVSHGGLIRTVEAELGARARPVPNLGGVWLHVAAGEFALGDRVVLVESDGHDRRSERRR